MIQPELKFGRKVIAWNNNFDPVKGRYIIYGSHEQEHWILDDTGSIVSFLHVKPDLDATPMNGDEVEGYDGKSRKLGHGRYLGLLVDGRQLVQTEGSRFLFCDSVRFPQPSKRDRVEEFLNSYYYPCDAEKIANEIDKIYTEDE